MAKQLLSSDQIEALLGALSPWRRNGESIEATYQMASFPLAIDLVQLVAQAAEEANHHPDMDIRWRSVRFVLTSHDAGGLTQRDADLARTIHAAAGSLGWYPMPSKQTG